MVEDGSAWYNEKTSLPTFCRTMNSPTLPKVNRLGSQGTLGSSARGRWTEILSVLTPELEEAIDAHMSKTPHVSCPNHGGSDGFRLFSTAGTGFNETGGGLCNTCGPMRDGFRMLSWVYAQREHGKLPPNFNMGDYPDQMRAAYSDVAFYLEHGYARNPDLRNRAPRLAPALTPEELKAQQEQERQRREKLMMLGQSMWAGARAMDPLIVKYMQTRGSQDIEPSEMMRLNPSTPYIGDGTVSYHPAIVMPVSRVDEGKLKVIALHRIYLEEHPDGRVTKAPVPAPKKVMPWGDLEGAAIRLFKASGRSLAVGEGVETMLSVHAMTGLPVWSCVTAWGLETLQIPDNIDTLLIAQDYDVSGKGQSSALKLADRARALGKTVIILTPQEFYDPSRHAKGVDWDDAYREDPGRARLMWEPYMEVAPPELDATSGQ